MTYTVEELAINDSFIAYCNNSDAKDTAAWNEYLYHHPGELTTIEEARQLVLGLQYMLQQKQHELSAADAGPGLSVVPGRQSSDGHQAVKPAYISKKWTAVAAVVLLLGIGAFFVSRHTTTRARHIASAQDWLQAAGSVVESKPGEYRTLILDDGTKVTLNAKSELVVSETFGIKDRNVRLMGEAFFEVAHNKTLPFIVQVAKYKVKAVGTKFNVKAYSNDKFSETSLLEGKVQILINNGAQDVVYKTLQINQKFVLSTTAAATGANPVMPKTDVQPLVFDVTNQNIETAWVDHSLMFENMPLEEIKNILERKYDLSITIKDADVARYPYTGSFKGENIDDVLKALQLSYPFSYKKEGNQITIYK